MDARRPSFVPGTACAALLLAMACVPVGLHAAAAAPAETPASKVPVKGAEVAKADAERKKPLQRCDELADKAQLECLQRAREHIAAARGKRETSTRQ